MILNLLNLQSLISVAQESSHVREVCAFGTPGGVMVTTTAGIGQMRLTVQVRGTA